MKAFRKMQRAARMEFSMSLKSLDDHSLTEGSTESKPSKLAQTATALMQPIRKAQETVGKISSLFKPQELVPKADEKKFTNAILKYQLKSILQGKVIDLLTLGWRDVRC